MSLYLDLRRYRMNRRQWYVITSAGEKIPLRVMSFRMHWGTPMTRQDAIAEQARLFPDPEARYPNEPGLLLTTICLEARASVTGRSDPWPDRDLKATSLMLDARVKTWIPSGSTIDNAVLTMCRAVVTMINQELEHRIATRPLDSKP